MPDSIATAIVWAMAFTYMLECADGTFYVGSTRNLERRVYEHQIGFGAAYTRDRRPVHLVWSEEHENIGAAFAREKQVQNWSRAKRIALIEGRYEDLPALARRRRYVSTRSLRDLLDQRAWGARGAGDGDRRASGAGAIS